MTSVRVPRLRRVLGSAGALIAVAVVLTACGSTADPASGGGTTSAAATSAAAPLSATPAETTAETSEAATSESAETDDTGASSSEPPATGAASDIEGVNWLLIEATSADGATAATDSADSTMSISDGRMTVFTGCNTGSAEATVEDGSIEVGPVAMTMMACTDPALSDLETLISQVYGGTVSYAVSGQALEITGDAGTLLYQNDGPADTDTGGGAAMSLTLESLTDADGKTVPLEGVESTLQIDGDEITFDTGCNTGGGQITIAGDEVTFGPMHMTMMACTEDGPAKVESTLLGILEGTASFTLEGIGLTVSNDAGTAVYGLGG